MCVDLSALVQLSYLGDLEGFFAVWGFTCLALARLPDEDMLLSLLETQLRQCKALGSSFVVFVGAPEGSPARTSNFRYDVARQKFIMKQRETMTEGLIKTLQKAAPNKTKQSQAS